MQKKIFIDRIDSPLGRSLYQQIRNDHIDINSYHTVFGTVQTHSESDSKMYFHFQSNQNLALKVAMQCDIILLDLANPSVFVEILLKYMKAINHQRPVKVIGISSFANWANTKKNIHSSITDPLELLKQHTTFDPFEDEQYKERTPSHQSRYSYQLQNLLISLNQVNQLTATVICRGLLYGGECSQFSSICSTLICDRGPVSCYREGRNYIPMIHIDDFSKMVGFVCETSGLGEYLFAVDDGLVTQSELLNSICSELGLFKERRLVEVTEYGDGSILNQHIAYTNLKLIRSSVFDSVQMKYKQGFIFHQKLIFQAFYDTISYSKHRFVIVGNNQNLRAACESSLKQEYGDKFTINSETLTEYVKDVQEKRVEDGELLEIINESQDSKKKGGDEGASVYPLPVLEKGIQSMIVKLERIGYLVNVPSINIPNVMSIPDQALLIKCDQKEALNPNDSKSMQQLQRTKTLQTPTYQGYRMINYLSPQYKQLFRNYVNPSQDKRSSKINQDRDQNQEEQTESSHSLLDEEGASNSATTKEKRESINLNLSKSARMKERIASMTTSDILSTQMKQYLIDTLMAQLIEAVSMIQTEKPKDIPEYFIGYLRGIAEREPIGERITFKPKSQKALQLVDGENGNKS